MPRRDSPYQRYTATKDRRQRNITVHRDLNSYQQQADCDFTYEPLDPPNAIRLLKVLPQHKSRKCILEVELWQANPEEPYNCLSYMWSDQTERFEILVNHKSFFVGRNLYDFLWELASRPEAFCSFWIDAICINQVDLDEKSVQVQHMGDVYARGEKTVIWLGPRTNSRARAMQWISTVDWSEEDGWLGLKKSAAVMRSCTPTVAKDLEGFLSYSYWERAWIVQEVVLSRHIALWSGSQTLNGDKLIQLGNMVEQPIRQFDERVDSSQPLEQDVIRVMERDMVERCMAERDTMGIWQDRFWETPCYKIILLSIARADGSHNGLSCFEAYGGPWMGRCSDPRDRIFSILSIVQQHPGAASTVRADYSKSAMEVFEMVWDAEAQHLGAHSFAECVRRSESLEAWDRRWARSAELSHFASRLGYTLDLHEDQKIKKIMKGCSLRMFFTYD